MEPIYDDVIVVGIKYHNQFNWYVMKKQLCYLNEQLTSTEEYMKQVKRYEVTNNYLRLKILNKIENSKASIEEYQPVIMIDFDSKIFYLQYPEPNDFADYLPYDWTLEEDRDFINLLENEDKYWIYKEVDFFNQH